MWNHTLDPHFTPNLFKSTEESTYKLKDMHAENSINPIKSVLLLKHHKANEYSVVQGGAINKSDYVNSQKIVCIQDCYGDIIAIRIKEFFAMLDLWLEESGSEIILDPHYYLIR